MKSAPFTRPLDEIERRKRDQKLWDMLPGKAEPYNSLRLSLTEFAALEEALDDGFGTRRAPGSSSIPLPKGIDSGLPAHRFYVTAHPTEEPDPDDERNNWEFWGYGDYESNSPPPSEYFPLNFHPNRLRIYFRNQLNRYCFHINKEDFDSLYDLVRDEAILASYGWEQFYEKPWYELYALQFLDFFEDRVGLAPTIWAGQLGRLVEQYYWRFQYEQSAKTGLGARGGASAGGKVRALKKQKERARWQAAAEAIWSRNPGLDKSVVAARVRRDLRLTQTASNIARYLRRPVKK